MPPNACEFLDVLRQRQHGFWWFVLAWWINLLVFVGVFTWIFGDKHFQFIQIVFYGSVLLIFMRLVNVYRLKCPFCQRSVGASPFLRYRFLYCKSCGDRIECKRDDSLELGAHSEH